MFNKKGTGALIDTRSEREKSRDFLFREVVTSSAPVVWAEKPKEKWRSFPIFDQNGSGSCVAQTMAKLLGVMYWLKAKEYVHFSATDIYQRRSNKPEAGMGGVNAFDIASKGTTLEVLCPSQKLTDGQMDAVKVELYQRDVGSVFKISNYLQPPIGDVETIASTIQTTGKAVMVWYYFTIDEWTSQPFIKDPALTQTSPTVVRHSVTAVDFTLVGGKKCLIIEDSWGTSYGIKGQRVITDEFHKARNFFAGYPMNFKFDDPTVPKPFHTFLYPMAKDSSANRVDEVVILQDVLKYEGLFPQNADSTGYYGSITAKAVFAFQKKYNVAPFEVDALQGRLVGVATLSKLNELYGATN